MHLYLHRWTRRLRPLAAGGVTLGVLQGAAMIDYNQIWFQFILTLLNAIISVIFGGSLTGTTADTNPLAALFG